MEKPKNKGGRPPKKHPGGRPPVITDKVLRKLEEAYLWDATDLQACRFARIGKSTLYKFQIDNPWFVEQKEAWKQDVNLRAKRRIAKAVDTDTDTALKVLERREKENYSTKVEHDTNFTFNRMDNITVNGKPLDLGLEIKK